MLLSAARYLTSPITRPSFPKKIRFGSYRMASTKRDPTTLSNYDKWQHRHITADIDIDFNKKQLTGNIKYKFESVKPADEIILDTSYLDIKDVKVNGVATKWELAPRSEPFGSPLKVQVGSNAGKSINVSIDIQTTQECTALQWLTKEQTSNKKHPYVFAQCQAIHGRSIFPCQDTPDVKTTFDFNVRSPLPVITSGLPTGSRDFQPGKNGESGTLLYTFKQEVPIASYLFSIVSGDIATAAIGPRSLVATGPEELQASKWEFEEHMEPFIQAAEKILQTVPYAWTTYNVLVLPPSFPYGGMETPVFTLATPTLISGDRENVGVVAHELAHSWSGNLVSNATWEHMWLNEGWTVYLERRIQAELDGEAQRGFHGIIGWKALSDSIRHFGEDHEFTQMVVKLDGKDPDDAFSSIFYEKGYVFLLYLEGLLGKEKFDSFVPYYFGKWARKSLDSDEFKATITDFFAKDQEAAKKLKDLDWDKWYYGRGFPPKPDFDTSLVDACYKLSDKWEKRDKSFDPAASDIKEWVANQSVVFLESVEEFETSISAEDAVLMGKTYGFADSKNVEVSSRYFRVALRAGDKSAAQPTAKLLGSVGRMKFVRPLFRSLTKMDRKLAEETLEKNSSFYHPICRQLVQQDLYGKK